MIQRIQTVWLALAAIFSFFILNNSFIRFSDPAGEMYAVGFKGISIVKETGYEVIRQSLAVPLAIISIPVLSVAAILLFRRRKLQKSVTLVTIAFSLSLCIISAYYWSIVASQYNATLIPGLKMVFPILILITSILAYIGIDKDDKIVKSYDRLR